MVSEVNADSPSNQISPNSSIHPNDPLDQTVSLDEKELYYDMSGRKYLFILNQETFVRTRHFDDKQPSTRYGTELDVKRLKEVFGSLNYRIITITDPNYIAIINILKGIASLEHTNTSCICLAILTHGDQGGILYAADRPYNLKLVEGMFGNLPGLANIPKLLFVQACRGGRKNAGQNVPLSNHRDSVLSAPTTPSRSDLSFTKEVFILTALHNDWTDDQIRKVFAVSRFLIETKKGFCMDNVASDMDRFNNQSARVHTVPNYADMHVLYSTVENFVSYRKSDYGTWMIQALCDTIEKHKERDIDFIMTMTKQKVSKMITSDNNKQMPETKSTLRKLLKF